MRLRAKVLAAVAVVAISAACRAHQQSPESAAAEIAGEPEEYSARVIRTINDGDHQDVQEMRVAVTAGKMRQEWKEQGQSRVLIWRPDLGKSYLLAPDQGAYVESAIYPDAADSESPAAATAGDSSKNLGTSDAGAPGIPGTIDPEVLDRDPAMGSLGSETQTVRLPQQTIDGHPCTGWSRQYSLPDGRTEVLRTYQATDLAGLAIRTETESTSPSGTVKITTERKDIQQRVSPDEFEVPAGFKKVDYLSGTS